MWSAIFSTIAAWFTGLLLDANLDMNPRGFLCLRVLFPVLVMGAFILYRLNRLRSAKTPEEDS